MLQKVGATVDGEMSGESGLERIVRMQSKRKHYQIALVDINMPGMDGLEVTKRLRAMINSGEIQPMKIIQCTAYSGQEDQDNSMRAGADGFTTKPVTYSSLLHVIK